MTSLWNRIPDVDIDGGYTQSAHGNTVGGDLTQNLLMFMRGQPPRRLGHAEVEQRVACHVPAGNHDEVVRLLRDSHSIALTGRPGSGRSTAAIVAMNKLLPGIPIRWFILDKEDDTEIGHGGAGCYLIRAEDGNLEWLRSCVDAVRASGGYLAVLADRELTEFGAASMPCVAVELPPPLSVYRRWVATHHRLPEWPQWEQAEILLRDALPADARRLADLAAKVNGQGGSLEERQAVAAQAFLGWDEELRGWFKKYPQPHDRALLIAAATLPSGGVSEGYVYAAASLLAGALRADVNGGGLSWWPVTDLGTLLEVSRNNSEITFHRAGFAPAVLRHALADYPLAHAEVLTWLSQLPTSTAATYGRANEATETFADLAAEHGAAEYVTEAAKRWGQEDLQKLAFIALSRTCLDSRVGGRVRQDLYDWSRNKNTPQTLKLVVAKVCELIGREYPLVALTRLKHLATRGNSQVVREVLDVSMALADAGQRSAVTDAAVQWCDADAGEERLSLAERRRRRRAGAMLFLELASAASPPGSGLPAILAGPADTDLQCYVQAWRAIFGFLATTPAGYRKTAEAVCLWLDHALGHDTVREQVCALFVAAAYPAEAAPSPVTDGAAAQAVIDIVQRWSAADHTDMIRTDVEQRIVIPLTSPWWLRLLRILALSFRMYRQARIRPPRRVGRESQLYPFG